MDTNVVLCCPAYAPQLGSQLRITHAQLNIVGGAGNVGGSISGPVVGRIVDSRGPRILFVCAFLFLLGGYSGIRYIYDKGIPEDATSLSAFSFSLLILFGFMTGAGNHCGITGALNTIAKTFPDRMRASASGLVISGLGLSAFLFSTISHAFFAGDTSSFLLLLAIGTSLPMILGFFLVRPIPLPPSEEEIPLDTRYPDDSSNTPLLEDSGDNVSGDDEENGLGDDDDISLLVAELLTFHLSTGQEDGDRNLTTTPSQRVRGPSHTPATSPELFPNLYGRKLWTSGDFWLLFTLLSLLSGTGLMYINNVGSMAQALYGYKNPQYNPIRASQWQATQVSTISLMNCAGRLFIGVISDWGKNHFGVPRSYFLTLVSFLFFTSQLATAFIHDIKRLWIASTLLGFAYGSLWSLFIIVCLEWFGMPHFSENWGYLSMSPMISGNLFSIIFGRNFDAHEGVQTEVIHYPRASLKLIHDSDPTTSADLRCIQGLECYIDSIYLTIGITLLSILLSVWAGWRDKWRG
ncbi:uncharacterized protein LACBIDRAFT_309717 [Laccaria bicolor S238N-H82]|uniref:Predicted protein n=1 Tax=Laccaria bicolor (strain S238N-H82 / ATCC MYA-4686) TaxID=486041 RepID=B0DSX1_LACBS|nr:uncharacterized protein LACBIDRAFT_309717 [Laccaria bicolor S238N-H82]EDR02388.1 predicted protein [Laccaria bicolor S238N-H82]|eukprot:XP_001887065.1 predicted protein [Laccaria bicolor S238N-H82]